MLSVNDRYYAANEQATYDAVQAEVETGIKQVLGDAGFTLSYEQGDPRRLFTVKGTLAQALDLSSVKV